MTHKTDTDERYNEARAEFYARREGIVALQFIRGSFQHNILKIRLQNLIPNDES